MLDPAKKQKFTKLQYIAVALDGKYKIPYTKIAFGWDSLIGLMPLAGDFLSLAASLYIVMESKKLGISKTIFQKMLLNILIDFLIGVTPVLGDILDMYWKCNLRNIKLLEQELLRR